MTNKRFSSLTADRLLHFVETLSHRAVREREQCFWIEGIRQFVVAFDSKLPFEAVLYSPVLVKPPIAQMIIRRLKNSGVPCKKVSPERFRQISKTERASGVGAIVRQHWKTIDEARRGNGLGWLVIESIRSPGNLGSILRTAEASGMRGALFVGPYCDPFCPDAVRGSMGGVFPLTLIRCSPGELHDWARDRRIQLVGLCPQAKPTWTDLPANQDIALVLGEERSGLSNTLRDLCSLQVRLPMVGRADSLNVAVATGIVIYELVRRSLDES
ncbi:MAG: RNA methyltransferase [Planctomycetota bacterium]